MGPPRPPRCAARQEALPCTSGMHYAGQARIRRARQCCGTRASKQRSDTRVRPTACRLGGHRRRTRSGDREVPSRRARGTGEPVLVGGRLPGSGPAASLAIPGRERFARTPNAASAYPFHRVGSDALPCEVVQGTARRLPIGSAPQGLRGLALGTGTLRGGSPCARRCGPPTESSRSHLRPPAGARRHGPTRSGRPPGRQRAPGGGGGGSVDRCQGSRAQACSRRASR